MNDTQKSVVDNRPVEESANASKDERAKSEGDIAFIMAITQGNKNEKGSEVVLKNMNQLQQVVVGNGTVEELNAILNGELAEVKIRAKSEGDIASTMASKLRNKNEKESDIALKIMNDLQQPGVGNEIAEKSENASKDERAKAQIRARYEGDTAFIMAIKQGKKELVEAFLKHRLWETILEQENEAEKKGCCTGNGCCTVKGCCTGIHSPMNELIREMPDMAVLAMNRCITKGDSDNSFKFNCKYLEENCKRKCNHALYTANSYGRADVIVHPLTIAFVREKWRKKGIVGFYIGSLFLYFIFVILLTVLATRNYSANAVIESQMMNETDNSNMRANIPWLTCLLYVLSALFAVNALLKLLSDIRIHHIVLINLTELAVFCCTLGMLPNNQTIDGYLNKFGIVPVTLFLAWFNFVLKLRKCLKFGIYFVMFTRIFIRLVGVILLFSPLLVGFALTFHMLLANKPLFAMPKVFATILSGQVGYSENLTPHLTKTNPEPHEFLAFPALTIITLVIFIFMVSISFQNLLVGLAVSDVEKLYEPSEEELTSLHIDEILDYDQIWAILKTKKFAVKEIEIKRDKLYQAPMTEKVGYNKRLEAAYLNDIVEKNNEIEQRNPEGEDFRFQR